MKFNKATFFMNEIFYVSLIFVLNNKSIMVIQRSKNRMPEHEIKLEVVVINIIVPNFDSL